LVCEDIFKEDVFQFDEFENRKFVWSVFEAGDLYQMKYSPDSNSRWFVDFFTTKIFFTKNGRVLYRFVTAEEKIESEPSRIRSWVDI